MSLFTLIRSTMNEYRILVVDDEEDDRNHFGQ